MAYSLKKLPNKAYEIPAPPPYAVWVEEGVWDYSSRQRKQTDGLGQVRHLPTLAKAKERVSRYATERDYNATPYGSNGMQDKFYCDWTIFFWNQDKNEYDVLYEGYAGETKSTNPLFKLRVKKGQEGHEPRPGFEEEVDEALASILKAVQ